MATVAVVTATPLISFSPATAAAALHYDSVWTADSAANTVSEYAASATGAATPIAVISGANTLLDAPSAVATDFHGHVFVTNAGTSTITEYAPGANGNVHPTAVIGGTKTGLDAPSSLSVAGDQLWVADPTDNLIEAFSVGTHGNELPAATFAGPKTKLNHPIAVSASSDGFEVDALNAPAGGPSTVTSYFAVDTGNQVPITSLTISSSASIVPTALMSVDLGEDWVVNSTGNALVETIGFGGSSQRLRQIKGSATGLNHPDGISHDAFGRVIVSNAGNNTVEVFSPNAHGNVRPLRVITGVGSAAGQPSAVSVFGTPPSAPVGLTATRHGRKVTLRWHPPATTGGGIIGYDIDEETGNDFGLGGIVAAVSLGGDTATETRKTTVTRKIRPGVRYSFRVVAVNAFGTSRESNSAHAAILTKPGAPTHVSTIVHHTAMLVTWNPPSRDGGTSHLRYHVQYGTCVPGKAGCHFKTKKSSLPFTFVVGLKKHTRYHVRVIARNSVGASKPSPVKTVKVGK